MLDRFGQMDFWSRWVVGYSSVDVQTNRWGCTIGQAETLNTEIGTWVFG